MEVEELAPGLWRWTAFHEEWKAVVGCVFQETEDAISLVDPLVPSEDRERFLAALDRDVERSALPVHVLVTIYWHTRSAAELADRYGAEVWTPSGSRSAVERRAGRVRAFRAGDLLPGEIEAFRTARRAEVVYYLRASRTLVPGDVILGADGGGLQLCPDSWLPGTTGRDKLRESLQPLLRIAVERVLVSHGEPVLEGGAAALRELLS
jgi:glyoxylase-like metal-dependent hydrolase (beta-lactamase superfamily II)